MVLAGLYLQDLLPEPRDSVPPNLCPEFPGPPASSTSHRPFPTWPAGDAVGDTCFPLLQSSESERTIRDEDLPLS